MSAAIFNKQKNIIMLGVDGGGTKTDFLLFSSNGTIIKSDTAEGCNPNSVGIEKCVEILKNGIEQMLCFEPDISAVYIGAAGFLLGNNGEKVKAKLCEIFKMDIYCNTDVFNVIASADVKQDDCMAVIGGTGFSVFVKEKDNIKPFAGWGFLINKWGSGFDIGRDALQSMLSHCEGIDEETLITDIITKRIAKSAKEIMAEVYEKGQAFVASFAKDVFDAYMKNDAVAKQILENNAYELSKIINKVSDKYPDISNLILAGSLFTQNDIYKNMVAMHLKDNLKMIIPKLPQICGACIRCAQICKADTGIIIENFKKQYGECD